MPKKDTRPMEVRFWEKVDKNGPIPEHCPELGQCWLWTGGIKDNGYGEFYINRHPHHAHRIAWEIYHGEKPTLNTLHHCDVRHCVRDTHLFNGTQLDNVRDMDEKKRRVSTGAKNPLRAEQGTQAKLTWKQIDTIRELFTGTAMESSDFARHYNVTPATIQNILTEATWKPKYRPEGEGRRTRELWFATAAQRYTDSRGQKGRDVKAAMEALQTKIARENARKEKKGA